MDFIFDEEKYIHDILLQGFIDTNKFGTLINQITRYNFHCLSLEQKDNFNKTVEWLTIHCPNFFAFDYYGTIESAVKHAEKYSMRKVNEVKIYSEELETISKLENIRQEKLLFTMLCVAKYQQQWYGYQHGKFLITETDLFKAARLNINSDEKNMVIHELFKKELIGLSYRVDGQEMYVPFIYNCQEDNSDFSILTLGESDYLELAYTYLNWKNKGGYQKCVKCKRLFKIKGNHQYCPMCRKYVPIEQKLIHCADCGKEVIISSKNTKTLRCTECQQKINYKLIGEKNIRCVDCGKEFKVDARNTTKIRCDDCQNIRNKNMKSLRNQKYYSSHCD